MDKHIRDADEDIGGDGTCFRPDLLPNIYALRLEGDCMHPTIQDGQLAVLSPLAPIEPGDFVGVFFKDRLHDFRNCNVIIKRLVMAPWQGYQFGIPIKGEVTPLMIIEQLNPIKRYRVDCCDVLAVHKVLGTYEPGRQDMFRLSEADARLIYDDQQAVA